MREAILYPITCPGARQWIQLHNIKLCISEEAVHSLYLYTKDCTSLKSTPLYYLSWQYTPVNDNMLCAAYISTSVMANT